MGQPSTEIVCFQCGQAVSDPPRWNHLPSGEPCRACAERLLDSLPPIFHSPQPATLGIEVLAEELEVVREERGMGDNDRRA